MWCKCALLLSGVACAPMGTRTVAATASGSGYTLSCASRTECTGIARNLCDDGFEIVEAHAATERVLWRVTCRQPTRERASSGSKPTEGQEPSPIQDLDHGVPAYTGAVAEETEHLLCEPGFLVMAGVEDEVQVGCILIPGADPRYALTPTTEFTSTPSATPCRGVRPRYSGATGTPVVSRYTRDTLSRSAIRTARSLPPDFAPRPGEFALYLACSRHPAAPMVREDKSPKSTCMDREQA